MSAIVFHVCHVLIYLVRIGGFHTEKNSPFLKAFPPLPSSVQMPGSSGTTQSMKKTIGHRGVETTTGETTYKKVRGGLVWGSVTLVC